MFDTLFCNARIVDGTGTPWFWGSLGVQDGFVAAVQLPDRSVLDALPGAEVHDWEPGGRR